jgi:hypothetical protein
VRAQSKLLVAIKVPLQLLITGWVSILGVVRVVPKVELVVVRLYVVVLGLKPDNGVRGSGLVVSCAKSAFAPVTESIKVTVTLGVLPWVGSKVMELLVDPIGNVGIVEPPVATKLLGEKPPEIVALVAEPLLTFDPVKVIVPGVELARRLGLIDEQLVVLKV